MISRTDSKLISLSNARDENTPSLELTPLIDLIFIVIVFLLLTANTRLLSLPVDIPNTDEIEEVNLGQEHIIDVTIKSGNDGWSIAAEYFAQWPVFKGELLAQLSQQPDSLVILAADKGADVQRFVRVLTLLQQQEIKNTRIILEKE